MHSDAQLRSDHPTVKDLVTQIRQCTSVYLDAIDMSIEASEKGISFAEDAFALCGLFSRGPSSELVAFLDDMISQAEKAHGNAQQTVEKFRLARRGFLQASVFFITSATLTEETIRLRVLLVAVPSRFRTKLNTHTN